MRKIKVIALCLTLALTLPGCGKETEVKEPLSEVIVVEHDESISNFMEMTRKEIMEMSLEEFRSSVEEYLPNYREHFLIPEDLEMTAEHWKEVRELLCIQLFGEEFVILPSPTPETAKEAAQVAGANVQDTNWIYEAPSTYLIEPMSTEEFRTYLVGLYCYTMPEEDPENFRTGVEVLSDEEVEKIKADFLADLKNS